MTSIDVLIVEDDPMVVEVNREFVNEVPGFKVTGIAKTGVEALEIMQVQNFNLALLDIYLPDMDGFTLLREFRRNGLAIDVIMVTAVQDAEVIQNVFRYGAVDYIIKPFKFSRLCSALKAYAAMYNSFNNKTVLDQAELDRLAFKRNTVQDAGEILPKGLNEVTLKQVLMCLVKETKPLSAEEVAGELGLARVTARRYLEYLESAGKVNVQFKYGSVGRPVKKFSLAHHVHKEQN
ncbi:response regulator [Desulfoscipio geothermicus]|uniref:Transcriptional regulatory protein n=1 Tax=Desulfoscipio geothermicus DSM 3669 TaxID=1121426 RepID=A0A1I6DL06_9FIRM|nr:response regulator [Desulfoscipio geothermicus]SFR06135.1 two-component system, CitB family, response regulator DctR [Desulfoscipio geothermicus DSM 3669]